MLDAAGLERLRADGRIEVTGCDDGKRYNAALWFVMKHGLEYVLVGDRLTMFPPDGVKPSWLL